MIVSFHGKNNKFGVLLFLRTNKRKFSETYTYITTGLTVTVLL